MGLNWSDGWNPSVQGPLRVEKGPDGWYVIGEGAMIPVDSQEEGEEFIRKLNEERAYFIKKSGRLN